MNDLLPPPQQARFHPIRGFPLMVLALLAYNIAMWSGYNFHSLTSDRLFTIHLISGAEWGLGVKDLLLIFGLMLLSVEIVKSTRSSYYSTLEHILSMVVFIIFIVEFLITNQAGTSTFMLLALMSLIDVMGGYAISIAVARRDLAIGV